MYRNEFALKIHIGYSDFNGWEIIVAISQLVYPFNGVCIVGGLLKFSAMRKNNNQKTTETTVEHREAPVYFNSNGNTPIDTAELNISFYQNFVQELGGSSAHRNLWPGETLLSIVQGMKRQYRNIKDSADRKRAARLIKQYKSLYKTLVNQ